MAAGRFRRLVDFSTILPRLKSTAVYTNGGFARQHPETVKAYLEALLTVHRQIEGNPASLEAAIIQHLGIDRVEAAELGRFYLAAGIWNVNGGIDRESVAYSIDFFTRMGNLPPGLTEMKAADLTYLDQVLDEIGRR